MWFVRGVFGIILRYLLVKSIDFTESYGLNTTVTCIKIAFKTEIFGVFGNCKFFVAFLIGYKNDTNKAKHTQFSHDKTSNPCD